MRAPIVSFVAAVVCLAFIGSGGAFARVERLLVNRNSGMCAELKDANLQVGARVSQGRCSDQPHQRWLFQKTAAVSRIVNVRSGMCLAARPSDGAAVVQAPCNGEASQNWSFRRVQDWFQIVSAVSGECLDVADSSIDDDAASLHAACGEANSQKWTLSDPALKSVWSPKISLPLIPVAASTLRNGKILMWASHDPFTFGDDQGKTFTTIFDLASGSSTSVTVSSTGHDMFLSGHRHPA
ncbi:RICIN domain-containing protein [Chenggangzhangella methanolivorans]|uniref:RICIN domain-containing protein n=1 Tax=Chenggangzhangella methanolivorans TaxID=1437009 RepID=A0A9E6UIU8_9HYPH|nr:RICIN domain-containing protein [Chenggangzhangella methanolivorans]QZO01263.1 RICIN domain-containing protein [Chenggangzhangella methanolivorans]